MKKQIALLVSLALTVSSFGFSAWADEVEVVEPMVGVGTEIITPDLPNAEEIDEVFSDFSSEGIEIEVTEDVIEVEEPTVNEDSEIVDTFEMGSSAMLQGAGEEVFVGEELKNNSANTTFDMLVNFENSALGVLSTGSDRTGTPTYTYDETLKSKVANITKALQHEVGFAFLKYQQTEGKKGMIETGVKFKTTDVDHLFSPIALGSSHSWADSAGAQHATVYMYSGNFYAGASGTSIGTAEPNTWYDLKVIYDIDGNAITDNTFSYELHKITANGNVLVNEGTGCTLTQRLASGTTTLYSKAATIKDFSFAVYGKGYRGSTANVTGTVSIDDAYIKYLEPAIESSTFKNGATGVIPGEAFDINFNQYMDKATYSNITVEKLDNTASTPTYVPVTDFRVSDTSTTTKAALLFDDTMEGNTSYRITVPASVKAWCGKSVAAGSSVIQFTTGEYIYVPPVDPTVTLDESFNSSSADNTTGGGSASVAYEQDNTLNSTVIKYKKYVGGTSNNIPYLGYRAYPKSAAFNPLQTGTFKLSVKFKADDVVNDDIFPITFKAMDGLGVTARYGVTPFVYINNGRFYQIGGSASEADKEIATAENNVWYELSVNITIDGDENTNDLFSYELKRVDGANITEGTKTLTGENLVFGRSAYAPGTATYNNYTNTGVNRIYFGGISSELTSGYSNGFVYLDDAKVIKYDVPEMTVTVADGASGVSVNEQIKLTFDQKVNSADFAKITLKQGDNFVTVTPDAKDGYTKTCTLKTSALEYNREYTLTIPAMKNQGGIPAKPMTIKFTTEKKPADVAISNVKVNGVNSESASYNFTPGSDITINANYQNAIASESKASLFVQLVNANGEVVKIGYEDITLSANGNGNIQAKVTIPQDIGAGAKVYIFAWDSIQTMTPVSNVVCID